jgi:NADPH-dependent 2,4-dienoyl-CoA reductase/sulfur reductase-like enzyme/nitrite reductase/ring-hydroxylating ferredoxin subunit
MSDAFRSSDDPDLSQGVALDMLADGEMLRGHVGDESVLLVRCAGGLFAVGATCTHYGAPLAEGLLVEDTIRCPWHHACFSLRTGAPLRPPALNALSSWRVEERDGMAFVREPVLAERSPPLATPNLPDSVIIIGGGAAGNAAAETLRNEGYTGAITLLSADESPPCDRPNLSKDYLAGSAPEEWIPLQPSDFYNDHRIELRLNTRVTAIDSASSAVQLSDGTRLSYGALLIATGAEPIRLTVPGAELPHVHVLRTLADSRALIARALGARSCVVVGASFIGLEAASALRSRGLTVHVVAPEARPMERVLGTAIADTVRAIHEAHGVVFHLGATVATVEPGSVTLSTGDRVEADLVVVGIGVRPTIAIAEHAGLTVDRGVLVDEFLQTSARAIYAAGDIVRWPDQLTGERIRVEHWVVAERQGQVAARNILGRQQRYDAVPFFWSQHYDITITYVGHAERWDQLEIEGDPAAHDCAVSYWWQGHKRAVATVGRDRDSLRAELAFEQTRDR